MKEVIKSNVNILHIDAMIFDFDGVLTDNAVYLNQNGEEQVKCSRADGLAFDVLHKLDKPVYILSTEKNQVVACRANKLKVTAIQGVSNKVEALGDLASKENYDLQNVLYVGNDLNDYLAMKSCGYSACPADSHEKIKCISNIVLKSSGGKGVIRELLEEIFNLDFIDILYKKD